jgi:hypothetical protein
MRKGVFGMKVLDRLRYEYLVYRGKIGPASFDYGGDSYEVLSHWYGRAWENSLGVEVPVVREFISGVGGEDLLEVGNVLNWYGLGRGHLVLDRWNRSSTRYVWNMDIRSFTWADLFDRVVGIRVMEQIRDSDGDPVVQMKRVVSKIRSLLSVGGKGLVTVEVGKSPTIDAHILNGDIKFDQIRGLIYLNKWEEENPSRLHTLMSLDNGSFVKRVLFCYIWGEK